MEVVEERLEVEVEVKLAVVAGTSAGVSLAAQGSSRLQRRQQDGNAPLRTCPGVQAYRSLGSPAKTRFVWRHGPCTLGKQEVQPSRLACSCVYFLQIKPRALRLHHLFLVERPSNWVYLRIALSHPSRHITLMADSGVGRAEVRAQPQDHALASAVPGNPNTNTHAIASPVTGAETGTPVPSTAVSGEGGDINQGGGGNGEGGELPAAFPKRRRGRPPGRPNRTVKEDDYQENPLVKAWNAAKEEQPLPAVAIRVKDALTAQSLVHDTQRAIFNECPSREYIYFVNGWITARHIASQRPSYVNGLLIHSRGTDAPVQCNQCAERRTKNALGPFIVCRILPGSFHNSCSNCKWFDNTSACSLYTGPTPNRKRKAKALSAGPNPEENNNTDGTLGVRADQQQQVAPGQTEMAQQNAQYAPMQLGMRMAAPEADMEGTQGLQEMNHTAALPHHGPVEESQGDQLSPENDDDDDDDEEG